jgi:hypothetical protein
VKKVTRLCVLLALQLVLARGSGLAGEAKGSGSITGVGVSRPFFNPSLGQKIEISFAVDKAGTLDVLILDRDGYLVRKLVSGKKAEKGPVTLEWDGRDERFDAVPDEAYSLKIDLASDAGADSFFPANEIAQPLPPRAALYDRLTGIISYKLPGPSRVHIQAGSAVIDKKTGMASGPVLKTVANREPRSGGPVIETWNGWDESGTIRVCDLPYFAIAVAATPLPDASIITVGNRDASFFDWVRARSGSSLFTIAAADHAHHKGLSTLDDIAPKLGVRPRNATWDAAARLWQAPDKTIQIDSFVEGPTAASFRSHPGKLMVFLDQDCIATVLVEAQEPSVTVPISGLSAGPHRVTLNWVSGFGPVAVNSILFRSGKPDATRTASK